MFRRTIALLLSVFVTMVCPLRIAAQAIKVTLLGTGTPIPLADRFGPSILVEAGGETLLFDVGRGATVRLWQLNIPLRNVSTVFFTHLHSDHVSGFPDLWLTGMLPPTFAGRTTSMQVYGPAGTAAMMTNLEKAFEADIRFRVADEHVPPIAAHIQAREIAEGVVYIKHGVTVTAFDVDHGELIKPALGYRIDYAGHSVVLSGDTRPSENLIRHARGADVLFHEVASARPETLERSEAARRIIGHHTTAEQAGVIFDRVRPRLAVYTHIALLATILDVPPPTLADLTTATRKAYAGRFEVGEDLMSVDVADTITVHRFSLPAQ